MEFFSSRVDRKLAIKDKLFPQGPLSEIHFHCEIHLIVEIFFECSVEAPINPIWP